MPGSSCISKLFTTNGSSIILLFAPLAFPSSCSTLWGLSYEQEVGQGHQCRQSDATCNSSVPSMENHTRICHFVIAFKLWHRFACSCVYYPSLIFGCHVHDAVAEPASECFCLPLWHEEFDNPWLVCDDTEQLVPWLHCIGRKYILVVYTVRRRHSLQSFDILDRYTLLDTRRKLRLRACCRNLLPPQTLSQRPHGT